MDKFIALLRGINVSGQKKIKMADLRQHLTDVGLEQVQTYIQSGNILFDSPGKTLDECAKLIKDKIQAEYSFDVPVMMRTAADIAHIVGNNPMPDVPAENYNIYIVTLLDAEPTAEAKAEIPAEGPAGEQTKIIGREIYTFYPNGSGRTKLTTNFFEKKLGVNATARNWKTLIKLTDMTQ